MDDRQAAWDLAWELDLRERRETARPVVLAEVEARVPNVPEEATRRAGIQGVVGCCVTGLMGASGVGLLWYGDVIAQSPRVIYMASSVGLLALLLGALAFIVTAWRFWVHGAEARRAREISFRVDQQIRQSVVPATFSWHRRASAERLREVQSRIAYIVEKAPLNYPRNDDLVELAGTYDTCPLGADAENLPETIRRLLVAFGYEDKERRAVLQRDGVA